MNSTTRGPYSNPANGTTHKTQDSIRTAQSRPEGSLGLVDLSQKIFEVLITPFCVTSLNIVTYSRNILRWTSIGPQEISP